MKRVTRNSSNALQNYNIDEQSQDSLGTFKNVVSKQAQQAMFNELLVNPNMFDIGGPNMEDFGFNPNNAQLDSYVNAMQGFDKQNSQNLTNIVNWANDPKSLFKWNVQHNMNAAMMTPEQKMNFYKGNYKTNTFDGGSETDDFSSKKRVGSNASTGLPGAKLPTPTDTGQRLPTDAQWAAYNKQNTDLSDEAARAVYMQAFGNQPTTVTKAETAITNRKKGVTRATKTTFKPTSTVNANNKTTDSTITKDDIGLGTATTQQTTNPNTVTGNANADVKLNANFNTPNTPYQIMFGDVKTRRAFLPGNRVKQFTFSYGYPGQQPAQGTQTNRVADKPAQPLQAGQIPRIDAAPQNVTNPLTTSELYKAVDAQNAVQYTDPVSQNINSYQNQVLQPNQAPSIQQQTPQGINNSELYKAADAQQPADTVSQNIQNNTNTQFIDSQQPVSFEALYNSENSVAGLAAPELYEYDPNQMSQSRIEPSFDNGSEFNPAANIMDRGYMPGEYGKVQMTSSRDWKEHARRMGVGMDVATLWGNARNATNYENEINQLSSAENMFTPTQGNRGYNAFNPTGFDPVTNQTPVQFTGMAKCGGVPHQKFQEGGTYEMSDAEIREFLANGGQLEFLD
jgi:hypothetical protein